MKIELKNIKHAEFASQETHCYEASLYVNGRRVAHVSNDGHGGADMVQLAGRKVFAERLKNQEILNEAREYLSGGDPDRGDLALESHCAELVNRWLLERDVKRAIKRRILFQKKGESGIFQCKAALKPTKANIDRVKSEKPEWQVLNDKPLDQLVEIWKSAA